MLLITNTAIKIISHPMNWFYYPNFIYYFIDASSKSTDRRVKSSIDLRTVDSSPSRGESPPSPQATSTRRRFWNSFRNKTSKKLQRKSKNKEASLSASQPNICNDKEPVDLNEDLIVYSSHSIESREKMSRKRLEKAKEIVESSPDRSLSDPNVTPIKERVNERTFSGGSGHSHSDENYDREDEGDSGIAVIENPAPAVEVRFREGDSGIAMIENPAPAVKVKFREGDSGIDEIENRAPAVEVRFREGDSGIAVIENLVRGCQYCLDLVFTKILCETLKCLQMLNL